MAGQLIPPPELSPTTHQDSTPQERVRMWCDLMNTCEHLHLAGLRQKVGPTGDVQLAYRQWLDRYTEQHDREMLGMMQRFARLGEGDDL